MYVCMYACMMCVQIVSSSPPPGLLLLLTAIAYCDRPLLLHIAIAYCYCMETKKAQTVTESDKSCDRSRTHCDLEATPEMAHECVTEGEPKVVTESQHAQTWRQVHTFEHSGPGVPRKIRLGPIPLRPPSRFCATPQEDTRRILGHYTNKIRSLVCSGDHLTQ